MTVQLSWPCSITGNAANGMIEVNVNVYDLTAQNQLLGLVGVGVFHSGTTPPLAPSALPGVEILGTEHTFGHSDSGTGVFEHEPRAAGGAQYRHARL